MERKYLNLKIFEGKFSFEKNKIAKFCEKKEANINFTIMLDKKETNKIIKDIREICKDKLIDKGTYNMYNAGLCYGIDTNQLSQRKFWRILQNFIPAIKGVGKYKITYHQYGDIDEVYKKEELIDSILF